MSIENMADLKQKIRNALIGSSSKNPVENLDIEKIGVHDDVYDALTELFQDREIGHCLVTRYAGKPKERHSSTINIWWLTGIVDSTAYGKSGRSASA
jgi:hypothetical protein